MMKIEISAPTTATRDDPGCMETHRFLKKQNWSPIAEVLLLDKTLRVRRECA